jgi:hypothetical protein
MSPTAETLRKFADALDASAFAVEFTRKTVDESTQARPLPPCGLDCGDLPPALAMLQGSARLFRRLARDARSEAEFF